MRAFKRFGIAQLICSCAFVPQASAVQEQLSDYALVSWREIGGLDAPVIYAITQDHDGYLWLGTNGGLIRFDGATFVRWDVGRRSRIPIGALAVAKDGSLWIGFRGGGGVSRIHGGEITSFTASQGVAPGNVRVVFEDDEGTIWVGAVGGLSRFQNSRWEHLSLRPQDAEAGVTGIYEDRHSQLWIATPVGIFVRPTGSDAFQQYASALAARAFVEDQEGVVWAATRGKGLVPLLEGDHAGKFSILEVNEGYRLLTSRSGDIWVATLGAGVFRLSVGTPSGFRIINHFTEADGLAGTVARALHEDGEGTLWIGYGTRFESTYRESVSTGPISCLGDRQSTRAGLSPSRRTVRYGLEQPAACISFRERIERPTSSILDYKAWASGRSTRTDTVCSGWHWKAARLHVWRMVNSFSLPYQVKLPVCGRSLPMLMISSG